MQKETRRNSAAGSAKPNPPRKLTRAEKKQIAEIIRQAKGDGKAHTAQQTIPYIQMYPDGICKVTGRKYSKTVAFEDINYQLAQADDKTAIFENWCDFLNYFDASVSVQLSFINQGTQRGEAEKAVNIPAQEDAFNSIRTEYRDMLKNLRLSLHPSRAAFIAAPKALKSYRGTGLFAIVIHPITFYCSPFFLDMST